MKTIIAADIGGTNARFKAFETDGQKLFPGGDIRFPTKGVASFEELMEQLTASPFPLKATRADMFALALAGPVQGGVYCSPPNIGWAVDMGAFSRHSGISNYILLNDFTAQAYACRTSIIDKAITVLPGKAQPDGVMAVLGAGTGLGKAILTPDGAGGYLVLASEGGHGLFPFAGEPEFRLQRFIMNRTGLSQVIWEHVVSGPGLSHIHAFLTGKEVSPAEVAAHAAKHTATLQWASRFYARACRNFALEALATGGVVISGGVAAKNPDLVLNDTFRKEFLYCDTHGELIADIPVLLNIKEDTGLWGAAFAAMLRLN
ncbi:MAG: glucokinase [Desulfobacterium sp.]|nr:glucokinase [Desulfobacterium sp.]